MCLFSIKLLKIKKKKLIGTGNEFRRKKFRADSRITYFYFFKILLNKQQKT